MPNGVNFNDIYALNILFNKTNPNEIPNTSNFIFNSNYNFSNFDKICNKQVVINNKTYSIDEKNIINTIKKFIEENNISIFQTIF